MPWHQQAAWWRHQMETFPRYWPYVRGINRSPVNSPHKGQWRGALMFSLICVWINGWVNNREAGDLGRQRVHYDVTVMRVMITLIRIWRSAGIGRYRRNHDGIIKRILIYLDRVFGQQWFVEWHPCRYSLHLRNTHSTFVYGARYTFEIVFKWKWMAHYMGSEHRSYWDWWSYFKKCPVLRPASAEFFSAFRGAVRGLKCI